MPRCDYCGCSLPEDHILRSTYGDPICQACFNNHYYHCIGCGRTCYQGDTHGDEYCYACFAQHSLWAAEEVRHVTTTKKTTTARCFGIELETSDCPKYRKLRGKTCFGVKEDGSIDGLEFYSPILSGDRGLAEVRNFCRLAKKYNFSVDEQCGFHLHIDMRDMNVVQRKHIAYAYRTTLELWQHLVNEDRWDNTYCEGPDYAPQEIIDTHDFSNFERRQCRYHFVNIQAYPIHKTYELRGYQGTLDATEICSWIKAHIRFVEYVKDRQFAELQGLFNRGLRRGKRNLRKILGNQLSRYYAQKWRVNADLIGV